MLSTASRWLILYLMILAVLLQNLDSLPIMRMKLCVASNNQYRLQNQCVYCHNKRFSNTVRLCTGVPYLPANVTLEEGYCMVRQCRMQMPSYRPEPFFGQQGPYDSINVNTQDMSEGYDNYVHEPVIPKPLPMRRRPPAQVFVGQPMRPMRPSLFGAFGRRRRSVEATFPAVLESPDVADGATVTDLAHRSDHDDSLMVTHASSS